MTIQGNLSFNSLEDAYSSAKGTTVKLKTPEGTELPVKSFAIDITNCVHPDFAKTEIKVGPNAQHIKLFTSIRA